MARLEAHFQCALNRYIEVAENCVSGCRDSPVFLTKAWNALNAARRASLTQQMEDFWVADRMCARMVLHVDPDSDIE